MIASELNEIICKKIFSAVSGTEHMLAKLNICKMGIIPISYV